MRCLNRNKKPFKYCTYLSAAEITDAGGNRTGEYAITYSSVISTEGNISPAKGSSEVEQFGNNVIYDKQIIIDDMSCTINENSIVFIDVVPNTDKSNFNYIVVKVAKSLNHIAIAIRKIDNA